MAIRGRATREARACGRKGLFEAISSRFARSSTKSHVRISIWPRNASMFRSRKHSWSQPAFHRIRLSSVGGTRDVSDKQQPSTENVGLSETVEVGAKRHFRVSVATKNLLASCATLEDFFRTLRGTAASAFIDAVATDMIVQQKRKAAESLRGLADLNRVRFNEGDIAEVDYNQASVYSLQAEGDLGAAQTTASNALLMLVQLLGKPRAALPRPSSDLKIRERSFELAPLLERAMQTRPDLVAA